MILNESKIKIENQGQWELTIASKASKYLPMD